MWHSLPHMVVFVHVVQAHSFTAAAKRLRISKPTVSKHISDLEQHLGTRLINRTTRSLALTEAGAGLYRRCRTIIDEIEAAHAEILRHADQPFGRLRLAAPTALGGRFMARILSRFLGEYPQMEIDLCLSDQPLDLIREELDLGIRLLDEAPPGRPARRLAACPRLVCASPDYCDRHGAMALPRDLIGHRCLECAHLRRPGGWLLRGSVGCELVEVRERICIDNCEALKSAVLEGLGIALVLPLLVEDDLKSGRLVRVLPDYRETSYSIFAVFPDCQPPPKALAFVEQLEAHLAATEGLDAAVFRSQDGDGSLAAALSEALH